MNFLIEKNKNEEYRVTIKIPEIIIKKNIIKKFNEINKNENINGFRKGKIPIDIIKKKYGNNIYYDVLNQLMQKFFHKFIIEKKINTIGNPKYYIHSNEYNNFKNFKYSVIYALKPIFKLQDIKSIQVKKIIVNITKQNILNQIQKNQKNLKKWKITQRSIKTNDRVLLDYKVYVNNQIIEEFHQKNFSLIISKNILLPQLYYQIQNHYINDVFFFKIHFSKFHPEKKLQDKEVIFKIKIKKIEEKIKNIVLSENQEEKIEPIYYKKMKEKINKKIKKINDNYIYFQIIQKLIKNNPIIIPHILIEEEIKNIYYDNLQKYQKNEGNILEKKYHINIHLQAKKNIHIKLIIQNIISENNILPDLNTIDKLIKKISLNYKKPEEIINLYKTDKNLIEKIKNIELEIQVMNLLFKKITIIEEYYTLDQAIYYAKNTIDNNLFYN
ncbi:trigger factor [Buchnera aphidicola]|uniref:trigger factor n=1 Tax=Buchnera aphidicola TaxID=9 RepID=UPI003BEEDD00